MKYFLILLLSSMLLFVSCSDDDSPSGSSGELKMGEMEATLDGKSFKSGQAQAMKLVGTSVQISGANISGETISLIIPNTQIGTFATGQGFVNIIPNFNPALQEAYSANFITYTLKSFENNELEGTFAFTANQQNGSKQKTVQNAKFKVKIVN